MSERLPILYCHCAYAKVVRADVKAEVLKQLGESGESFDAVADLCEMSAKRDPALKELAQQEGLQIAACYPRAVKWLFSAADAPLVESIQVHNMRTESADDVVAGCMGREKVGTEDSEESTTADAEAKS